MTSQLKIRCLLKTTAKKLWIQQKGERVGHVLRKEEEIDEEDVWDRKREIMSNRVCDKQNDFYYLNESPPDNNNKKTAGSLTARLTDTQTGNYQGPTSELSIQTLMWFMDSTPPKPPPPLTQTYCTVYPHTHTHETHDQTLASFSCSLSGSSAQKYVKVWQSSKKEDEERGFRKQMEQMMKRGGGALKCTLSFCCSLHSAPCPGREM